MSKAEILYALNTVALFLLAFAMIWNTRRVTRLEKRP